MRDLSHPLEVSILGLFIFGLPALLSALISKPLAEGLGGHTHYRRTMILVFLSLVIFIGLFLLLWGISLFLILSKIQGIVIAYSVIFWLRHSVFVTISNSNHLRSLPASINQGLLGVTFAFILIPEWQFKDILLVILLHLIFLFAVIVYVNVVASPIKRNFKADGLALSRHMIDHMTEGGTSGLRELENFFKSFSQRADIDIGVISFKPIGKSRPKVLLIVPSVHPGPFGRLGGSDLPVKLQNQLKGTADHVFVPHGPAIHDMNISVSKECNKISKWVKNILPSIGYYNVATRNIALKENITLLAQRFGDMVLLTYTSAPNPTDDIESNIGVTIRDSLMKQNFSDVLFIDAHNCVKPGSGSILSGTNKANLLINTALQTASKTKEIPEGNIRVGYSSDTSFTVENDGIGSCGIQVVIIETLIEDKEKTQRSHRMAYVLFDGNNMKMGLRENLLSSLKDLVSTAEILTTDNHAVNATIGGFNPVGLKAPWKMLIHRTKKLVKMAINDLEAVEVGYKTGKIQNVLVFGKGTTIRLSQAINSSLSRVKSMAVFSILMGIVGTIVIFYLFYLYP
jgi:putative membrane protein